MRRSRTALRNRRRSESGVALGGMDVPPRELWRFVVRPAPRIAALGSKVSRRSPRSVIVAQLERVPFAAHYERLPIGREYRFGDTSQLCSGVDRDK